MSDERVKPFLVTEDLPAPRLESAALVPEKPERKGASTPALVASGVMVLLLGLSGLEIWNFVADEFARAAVLGWASVAIASAGIGLIGGGLLREAAAMSALSAVDKLRDDLASSDAKRRVKAARAWVKDLPEGPALLESIRTINDPDAILALLRAGPGADFRGRADALGRNAALQAVAGLAAMPSAGLAGIYVAWRGLRLIRQVASVHGLRPGLLGTLGLLRRTALAAGSVAATEVVANTAAHALLSNPLLAQLAGDMAGAGIAARRMIVLARAADAACSPLPPDG